MFSFFSENNFITQKKSGFKPCINQLFSIVINDEFEVRNVFLDISKVLEKVCHQGIIFKLKLSGISGDLPNIEIF